MSVTFSGGITFTGGGFSFSAAPPASATAGWFSGGYTSVTVSLIDRIIFATDTATASVRGPLSRITDSLSGSGTLDNGWFSGGNPSFLTTVNRITYATDTATTSVRGPLNAGRYMAASSSDGSTYSWFSAGFGSVPTPQTSQVSRITYATDTDTASARGPLAAGKYDHFATGTSSYGWHIGGRLSGGNSSINRIDYANDTGTASIRGPLSANQYGGGAVTDGTTYGWVAGGFISNTQRIVYATDTDTATTRGTLPQRTLKMGATCDTTYGWFGGGYILSPNQAISTITRLTYANDTTTTTDRGFLSLARRKLSGGSGVA
jgi:hypothetical protein